MKVIPDRIKNPVSAGSAHRKGSGAGAAAKANEAKARAVRKALEKREQRKIQLSKMPGGRGAEELERMKKNDRAAEAAKSRVAASSPSQAKKMRERDAQLKGMGERSRVSSDKEIEAGKKAIEARRRAMRGKIGPRKKGPAKPFTFDNPYTKKKG